MKTLKFNNREEWLGYRLGKITGSRLKDVITLRGTGKKIGFYELIAERLAQQEPVEYADEMERGNSLEPEAITRFEKETGKKVDSSKVIWSRDDNESIAISPDGSIGKKEAVEVKCLSSAHHIKAFIEQEIPDDGKTNYKPQCYQYFIVNEKLETLYFVMYDPRIPSKDFFYLTLHRKDIQKEIDEYLEYQRNILKEVDEAVLKLSNF